MPETDVNEMFYAFNREFLREFCHGCPVHKPLFNRDGVANVDGGDDVALRVGQLDESDFDCGEVGFRFGVE